MHPHCFIVNVVRRSTVHVLTLDGQVNSTDYLDTSIEGYGGEEAEEKAIGVGGGRQLGPNGLVETHAVVAGAFVGSRYRQRVQEYYY